MPKFFITIPPHALDQLVKTGYVEAEGDDRLQALVNGLTPTVWDEDRKSFLDEFYGKKST